LEDEEEFAHFFKHNQVDYVYNSQEITEFNLMKFIHRIEKNQKYDYLAKERDLREKKMKTEKQQDDTNETNIHNSNENEKNFSEENKEQSNIIEDELDKSIVDNFNIENVLLGFETAGVKITLLSGNIDSHIKKKKYNNFFDFILLGFTAQNIFANISKITKKNSKVLVELNSYMTAFNDENKNEYKEKLKQLSSEYGLVLEDTSSKHTWKFFKKS
jgi:hypothetical protein